MGERNAGNTMGGRIPQKDITSAKDITYTLQGSRDTDYHTKPLPNL